MRIIKRIDWCVLTIGAICLFAPGAAQGQHNRLQELGMLVEFEEGDYFRLRTDLMRSSAQSWDVAAAARVSWEAGLTALIVNEGLENQELYAEWDQERPIGTRSRRGYGRHPAAHLRNRCPCYLIEQIWKTARVEQWRHEAFKVVIWAEVPGPQELWLAVAQQAEQDELKGVALSALASSKTPEAKSAIRKGLNDPESTTPIRLGALTGLARSKPSYATQFITEALPLVSDDIDVTGRRALWALANLDDPEARQKLHELANDADAPILFRVMAIRVCEQKPKPEDIAVFESLADGSAPVKVRAKAVYALGHHPEEKVGPILLRIMRRQDDPEIVFSCASAFYFLYYFDGRRPGSLDSPIAGEALVLMEAIAQDGSFPEHVRKKAERSAALLRKKMGSE